MVVSLTSGNSVLPLGDGLVGHAELLRQLLLREILFLTLARDVFADGCSGSFGMPPVSSDAAILSNMRGILHPPVVEFEGNCIQLFIMIS